MDSESKESNSQSNNKCAYEGCTGDSTICCSICMKNYCEDHFLDHDCQSRETNSSTPAITEENSKVEEENSKVEETYKKCDYPGCTNEAPFFCSVCSSYYCVVHPFEHECCGAPIQIKFEKNNSKENEENDQNNTEKEEKKSEPVTKMKKCDYPGCTNEAPFFCSVCSKFYCPVHPFEHECGKY